MCNQAKQYLFSPVLFHLIIQMNPILKLNQLHHLHGNIWLVAYRTRAWKIPEVPSFGITARKVQVGDVRKPMLVFRVQFLRVPSPENFPGKRCYLSSLTFRRVKKAAWVYVSITFLVSSSDPKMSSAIASLSIFFVSVS